MLLPPLSQLLPFPLQVRVFSSPPSSVQKESHHTHSIPYVFTTLIVPFKAEEIMDLLCM